MTECKRNCQGFSQSRVWRCICILLLTSQLFGVQAQKVVPIPYGDMDQWMVREIKESPVIGGKVKSVYEIAPTDTVRGSEAYQNMGGSPWGTSNVLAKVAGVVKTNTSVFPEERGDGWCARLETRYESVKVMGLVDIEVIAAGSIFLGYMHEPIRGTKNPDSKLCNGIPFTDKPTALQLDYKIKVAPEEDRIRSTGFSKKSKVEGRDSLAVVLFLQKRWEDEKGNVYAKRVGTMVKRYWESTGDWVNAATYPILYGDITKRPEYEDFMQIQVEDRYTVNAKGKTVPIQETGWAEPDDKPTHIILQFTSSHGGAYIGSPGNTMWVDNVSFVY